jgi:hypothetical protein
MLVMASGRRRGFALASAACVPVLVLGTAWLFVAGDKGTAIAGVLAVPLAALPLMAWFFDWKPPGARSEPEELWPVCLKLAYKIEPLEAEARNWFLAEHGSEGAPADVEFTRYRPKDPDRELVSWRSDGGALRGTLAGIAGFCTTLNKGRLVVLGAPGAGKTVLANELLLGLIKALPLQDPGPRTKVRVPVRLSLASFDPGNDAEETRAGELAERLEAWIAGQLSTTYKLTPSTAQRLVKEGRILPILDGLDEMDAEGQVPDQARAVVRTLNHPADHGVPPWSWSAGRRATGNWPAGIPSRASWTCCRTLPSSNSSPSPSRRSPGTSPAASPMARTIPAVPFRAGGP